MTCYEMYAMTSKSHCIGSHRKWLVCNSPSGCENVLLYTIKFKYYCETFIILSLIFNYVCASCSVFSKVGACEFTFCAILGEDGILHYFAQ